MYRAIEQEVDRGDFRSTLAKADDALRRYGSGSPEWEWHFRILKARILVSSSKSDEALSILEAEPPPSLSSTEIPEQRKLYQGIAHRYKQSFDNAEHDFDAARGLVGNLGPLFRCQLLIARADLLVDEGYYDKAESDYREALADARQQSLPRQEAAAIANWARLSTKQGHIDEALDRYREALKLSQGLGLGANTATILGNLGWSYSELGDFEASLDYFNQSAQQSAQSGLGGYSAYWFSGAANAYFALREYSDAEQLARSTLESAKQLNDPETIAVCLNTLTRIMLRTNRFHDADRTSNEATNFEKSGRDKLHVRESTELAGEVAEAKGNYSEAEELLRHVASDPETEPQLLWQVQAALARVREDQGRSAEAERGYLQAIETIEKARRSINHDELRLSFLSSGIEVYGEYIDFLVKHARMAQALVLADLSRARTLAEGLASDGQSASSHTVPRRNPEQISARIKATLLFYWIGETQSHLWVITPAKTTHLTLPPAGQIDPLVKSYTDAVAAGQDVSKTQSAVGEKLHEILVAPAEKLIPRNSRVVLLPDGKLYGLNFETLIVREPTPHFWIEDITLSTASSLALLASAESRPVPKDKSLFLVGDAVPPNDDFPRLPQAPAEMIDVEKYFAKPHLAVLSGSQATPAAYLSSQPEKFAYMHFVTHGTASRARPLESAVVLSKEAGSDSFKLYARDIITKQLRAYLVTISACNGAGTRAYSGEGLVGLSWAFLRAGAHNVIGALWEVSDNSTPELMDKLYEGLSTGEDAATALRAAKLSLLHSDSVYRKPYYWAPFQLYAGS